MSLSSSKTTHSSKDQHCNKMKDQIQVILMKSDGIPITGLSINSDLSIVKINPAFSDDMVRFTGIAVATLLLFEDLTEADSHKYTIMQGELSKVAIVNVNGLFALSTVSAMIDDDEIIRLLRKAIDYWINRY